MASSPPPGLPTALLTERIPNFHASLILPNLIGRFDARDDITLVFLDDAELNGSFLPNNNATAGASAASVSGTPINASLTSLNTSDVSGPASVLANASVLEGQRQPAEPRLRVAVIKQDAVIEATSIAVYPPTPFQLSVDALLDGSARPPPLLHALPPPPSASQLIPLGNSGPVRALKLSPRVPNAPQFLAILRSPKAVELFEVGTMDGEPPRRIQEISRDRRNAEGIVGIEWVGPADILIVGSNGVEGYRYNTQSGQFVLRKSQGVAVSWYLYSASPRLLLLSSTQHPSSLLLFHLPPDSLTLTPLPPLRFPSEGQGVYLRPMRREFAVVQAYGAVFVVHVQGTRITVHRTTTTGCTVQGVHDLSFVENAGGCQFVVGPSVDEGLVCVHELVGRTTTLLDVRYGIVATTRIESEAETAFVEAARARSPPEDSDEPLPDLYTSLADPSTSHPSTTSPATLARYPFLLSTLTGRLFHLRLDPTLLFRILVHVSPIITARPMFSYLDAVRFVLTKSTLSRPALVLALLRTMINTAQSPESVRRVVSAILTAAGSAVHRSEHSTVSLITEETSADVLDALNESLFDPSPSFPDLAPPRDGYSDADDRRSLGSKSDEAGSKVPTPARTRTGSLVTVFGARAGQVAQGRINAVKLFEGPLALNGEVELEEADIVKGLGELATGDADPADAYQASLLVHLLPLLPSLAPSLVSVYLKRGELRKLEQVIRTGCILPSRDVLRLLDVEIARISDSLTPSTPIFSGIGGSPELEVDTREYLSSVASQSRRLLLSLRHDLSRKLGPTEQTKFAIDNLDPLRATRIAEANGAIGGPDGIDAFTLLAKTEGDPVASFYLRGELERAGYVPAFATGVEGSGGDGLEAALDRLAVH